MVYSDSIAIGHMTDGHIEKVRELITFSQGDGFLSSHIHTMEWTPQNKEYHFKYAIVTPKNYGLNSANHLCEFITEIEQEEHSHFISFEEGLHIALFQKNKLHDFSVEMFTKEFPLEKRNGLIIPAISFKEQTYLSQKDFSLDDKIVCDSKWIIRIGEITKGAI